MMKYSKLILKDQVFTGEKLKNLLKLNDNDVDIYTIINNKYVLTLELKDNKAYKVLRTFTKRSDKLILSDSLWD